MNAISGLGAPIFEGVLGDFELVGHIWTSGGAWRALRGIADDSSGGLGQLGMAYFFLDGFVGGWNRRGRSYFGGELRRVPLLVRISRTLF